MGKRIAYLDQAKGILIILMLIGHIWNDGWIHDVIYVFHMPAFFVISGILLNYSSFTQKTAMGNLTAKIRSLLVPYLCFEVFGIFLHIAQHGITLNIKGYLFEMISLRLFNGPLWFLAVMFLCQCVFLLTAGNMAGRKWLLCLLLALMMVLPKYAAYISISTTVAGLFFLLVGYQYEKAFSSRASVAQILVAVFVTVAAAKNDVGLPDYQDGSRIVFVLGALAGTFAILELSKRIHWRWLGWFGRNSIIVLGSHYPILRLIKYYLGIDECSALSGICILAIMMVLEVVLIQVINQWMPFVAGRPFKNRKTQNKD